MLWSKKPAPAVHDRSRLVGIDLTASRARAVSVGSGRSRTLCLDGGAEDLALFVNLDRRPAEIGLAGAAILRKLPHAVCRGFLPYLGQPRTWTAGRQTVNADAALALAFDRLRGPVSAEAEAAALVLPVYLTATQAAKAAELAAKAKLPLRGTASAPLAVAAHRAAALLDPTEATPPPADADGGRPDWVVPMRPPAGGPTAVVVVDADEAALSTTLIAVEPGEVRLIGSATWPKLSLRLWKERLLDALSDRCVRVCRRDPRDSADAEQALFDQLDAALDATAYGQPVTLTVRSAHWYQDLPQRPEDFAAHCAALAKPATDGLRELITSANLPVPPRAVWLTDAAARLPGLAAAVYAGSPEQTAVEALPPTAAAEAAAALVARWQAGWLPRVHLDTTIPLDGRTGAAGSTNGVHGERGGLTPRGRVTGRTSGG